MDLAALRTIENAEKFRFELKENDKLIAFIDYKIGRSGNWYLIHTEVLDQERRGIGHKIVRESLAIMEERNLKLVPSCPFVRAFIKKNRAEYEHLLADGVKLDD